MSIGVAGTVYGGGGGGAKGGDGGNGGGEELQRGIIQLVMIHLGICNVHIL